VHNLPKLPFIHDLARTPAERLHVSVLLNVIEGVTWQPRLEPALFLRSFEPNAAKPRWWLQF
jgi:hypothetical protein